MNWVPISKIKHRDKALSRQRNYFFAKAITLVPICLEELLLSVTHMPLVFYHVDDGTDIGAVLGLEDGQNLFVRDDGSWSVTFLPAAFRCHPFSAIYLENGESTIVYRDDCGLIVDRGDGDPFFNTDGSAGEVFKSLATLTVAFQRDRKRARAACSLLKEFELLTPLTTKFQKDDGSIIQLGSVYRIDRAKFNDLDIKKFEKLRDSYALDLIYAHFFSLNCFSVLLRLMSARKKMESNLRGLGLEIFGGKEEKMDFNF